MQVTHSFTWFYVGTQGIWLLFVLYVMYKYGHIRLGAADSLPEFDDVTYFAMLFAAGVAVGLFFYGASEPLAHADVFHITDKSDSFMNRFTANPSHTMDEADMYAMTLTVFHWALGAWAPYLVVALSASLAHYNFGLPMTFRSCLYPVIGELTWGWAGDLVDAFTIVTVVSGVCTSLGIGAQQLVTGLRYIGALAEAQAGDNSAEVICIWIVTIVATLSVISGLNVGIKLLSYFAFILGSILWFLVLALDQTSYLLNVMVEVLGSYLWWLPYLSFATDAFGQLGLGDGSSVAASFSANESATFQESFESADEGWMNGWTVFYFAWWTAWASFVGLFVARISRGRTIRQVVLLTLIAPVIYVIMWFSVFGGAALRQARVAGELVALSQVLSGNESNTTMFLIEGTTCYEPPLGQIQIPGSEAVYEYQTPGITPVCLFDPSNSDSAWFNMLGAFFNYGNFLSILSLAAIAIYFVTSSDSGSLIVDQLASNGRFDHHWLQRVLWAFLEGGVATGLIIAGGAKALRALQAASIIAGLPFTILLCFACASILNFCSHIDTFGRQDMIEIDDSSVTSSSGDTRRSNSILTAQDEHFAAMMRKPRAEFGPVVVTQFDRQSLFSTRKRQFVMPYLGGVFNYLEWLCSFGKIHPELAQHTPLPNSACLMALAKGGLAPFVSVYEICNVLDTKKKSPWLSFLLAGVQTLLFFTWIGCFAVPNSLEPGISAFGWLAFVAQAFLLTYLRLNLRQRYNIAGGLVYDFLCCFALYPQVLCQMQVEIRAKANIVNTVTERPQESADTSSNIEECVKAV